LPRKVLLTIDTLGIGGAERQFVMLVKCLPPTWEPLVWSMDDGFYLKILKDSNISVVTCERRSKWSVKPFLNLQRTIKEWQPEVVHSWSWWSAIYSSIICHTFRIPFANGIVRSASIPKDRLALVYLSRLAFLFSDIVISNTQAGLNAWKVPRSKRMVVYNGFDFNRLNFERLPNMASTDKTIVIMTARMSPAKDFFTFLEAAKVLAKIDDKFVFWVVGNGPEKSKIMNKFDDLIREGKVILFDGGNEVIQLVQKAHIGVLMSNRAEGCSNSIMEYMACGLPVICSDGEGNRELVKNGETGFIVQPKDINALVEKILYLKQNATIAIRMGDAGEKRIYNEFSLETMVTNTVHLYEKLIYQKQVG
jgi:glycosyltransferase involved in cell wall biosynthesis